MTTPRIAIVDYEMGNLYSVKRACEVAGLAGEITQSPSVIRSADGVILPGVGAFGDAMQTLRDRHLIEPLTEAARVKPFLGICLGLQLLMTRSSEFGENEGFGLIKGDVIPFVPNRRERITVPHVGWNRITPPDQRTWSATLFDGIASGEFMYFVHSYYARPLDPSLVLSTTTYGPITFCSSLNVKNIFGCQFHPERSGAEGLRIYRNFATCF